MGERLEEDSGEGGRREDSSPEERQSGMSALLPFLSTWRVSAVSEGAERADEVLSVETRLVQLFGLDRVSSCEGKACSRCIHLCLAEWSRGSMAKASFLVSSQTSKVDEVEFPVRECSS